MIQYKQSKLVEKCTLPLTGKSCVNFVVTNLGVFKIEKNKFVIIDCISAEIEKHLLEENIFKLDA